MGALHAPSFYRKYVFLTFHCRRSAGKAKKQYSSLRCRSICIAAVQNIGFHVVAQVSVLKRMQGCPHVCKYLHCGHFEEHNYLVMELLGMNLSELRRRLTSPRQSFSPATTVRLVVQMIQSVAALHNVGFLHRDIKPSNFAVGAAPQRRQQCIMIDFGLARKYRLPNGQIRPARDVAGFRGTARCSCPPHVAHHNRAPSSLLSSSSSRPTGTRPCKATRTWS